MIIARTPMRISFFGGGTDYPSWYRQHGGAVLATTIDKYSYITCRYLPPFFEYRYCLVYSKIEHRRGLEDIEHPAILLYEKDAVASGGFALVGVSYLFDAEPDADGQPKNPPFPKSLASWHRHSDLCVLPDRRVTSESTAEQCQALGGRFAGLTQWMVHAWIWKESPTGVFSGTNPTVR